MNATLQLLHNHRSIRKFTPEQLSMEQVKTIVQAGQRASTSSNVMAYSIIGVTDENIKKELKKVSGQPYVEQNGYLFVICADLSRIAVLGTKDGISIKNNIESTEQFIVATADASLLAQNMVIAAESLGLGACFLGSLRNDINRIDTLLELPEYVIPLFGIAMGYPNHQPEVKPRLPFEAVFHENTYNSNNKQQYIDAYDETLNNYYQERSTNNKLDNWTNQMIRKYRVPTRMDVAPYVQMKNLNKH